ncbi:MAG: bifunctional pyr operon transcriptional regulator/uracil phosphoribosyltransferase PyrR [Phycisphaeraceae bacterium]
MQVLADQSRVDQLIDGLAEAIRRPLEQAGPGGWALVGVRRRGDVLARRLAERLENRGLEGQVGSLDITLYRDDLSEIGPQPVVRTTEIDFNLDGRDVVLVDDVLMTGRSTRAALQSLLDFGRPRRIWLAVLVDRGGRELPIAPDFVALDLTESADAPPASADVQVLLAPEDDRDAIAIRQPEEKEAPA